MRTPKPQPTDLSTQVDAAVPPWVLAMRQAAQSCVSEDDVKEMVRAQMDAAKKGSLPALKFVFEHILSGGVKGGTFIQNNFTGDDPSKKSPARCGTLDMIEIMSRRAAAHTPLSRDDDGPDDVDLT